MKELQEIEERLAELNERYKDLNLDETGYFELRFIRRFYTSLHFREDEIVNTALRRRMNNEIDDIMHRYDGNVKIVSSPDKEFTVKYVLTFNHSIIRSIL